MFYQINTSVCVLPFPLCKTTSGKRENISHKRKNVRQTKPADACKLNKGGNSLASDGKPLAN